MEKVIYENESGKMVVELSSGVVTLTQYLDDELVGMVSMYPDEFRDINGFLDMQDNN